MTPGHIADAIAEPHTARPRDRRTRGLLAAMCFAVGVMALAGGAALLISPDGSLLRVPRGLLAHLTLSSFVIPGLVLALVPGAGNLLAAVMVMRGHPRANTAALAGGIALVAWVVGELVLGLAHPLQLVVLLLAFAIMMEALRRRAEAQTPPRDAGPVTDARA